MMYEDLAMLPPEVLRGNIDRFFARLATTQGRIVEEFVLENLRDALAADPVTGLYEWKVGMTDDRIGSWVHRVRLSPEARLTFGHLVESVIADEPVTRCGRRLKLLSGTELRYGPAPLPHVMCSVCQ